MPLTVSNGTATPNTPMNGPPSISVSGTFNALKQIYVMEVVEGPGVGEYTYTWRLVQNWAVPTQTVPGLGIMQSQFDPPTAQVYWSVVSNTLDERYPYFVRVRWYVNGIHEYTDEVSQLTGDIERAFSFFDSIYARVCYTNTAGEGPITQTSTLNL